MSNNKKINFNKFAGIITEHKPKPSPLTYTTANGEDFEVTVKPRLDLAEMAILVNSVVQEVFSPVDHSYNPEIYDLVLRKEVVSAYANVATPDDLDKMVDLLYYTNLFKNITDAAIINMQQYEDIIKSIDLKITFKINEYLKKSKLDDLLDALTKWYLTQKDNLRTLI